jgi:hypothetical protein
MYTGSARGSGSTPALLLPTLLSVANRGDDTMQIEMMSIQDVHPYENNPRMNDNAVDAVAESIKQYGFKVPIVVDTEHVIVTGHTRLRAAEKLGMTEVPVIVASDLSPEQCRAFRIADNKVSDYSIFDNKKLLEELDALDDDLFTGFTESDIFDDVVGDKESPLDDLDEGFVYEASFKSPDEEKIKQIEELWNQINQEESDKSEECDEG